MNQINVQDKVITTSRTVKSIEIDSVQVKLNESATFVVKQLDENGQLIGVEMVQMTGADYTGWGSDDTYVTNFILTKLGLTEE